MAQQTAFHAACAQGDGDALLALLDNPAADFDVRADNEAAFLMACWNGHSDVVHTLLALEGPRAVNVHALNEYAFRGACHNGRSDVVRILLALDGDRTVDVDAYDEDAFRMACEYGRTEVVRILLELGGARAVSAAALADELRHAAVEQRLEQHLDLAELLAAHPRARKEAPDAWATVRNAVGKKNWTRRASMTLARAEARPRIRAARAAKRARRA
jgi:ankyrin repeat protein